MVNVMLCVVVMFFMMSNTGVILSVDVVVGIVMDLYVVKVCVSSWRSVSVLIMPVLIMPVIGRIVVSIVLSIVMFLVVTI